MPVTQPAKYHSGVKPSVKDDRERHFKAKKAGPAPGDKGATTKPSVHTKKYNQMYGEVLGKDADIGDYVKDFKKSDAPQFKGKSDKKKHKMAVAAYLSRNEEYEDELNEWGEIEEDSEYQGRKVKLNKPMPGDVKKSKVYVKNEKGNVVKV